MQPNQILSRRKLKERPPANNRLKIYASVALTIASLTLLVLGASFFLSSEKLLALQAKFIPSSSSNSQSQSLSQSSVSASFSSLQSSIQADSSAQGKSSSSLPAGMAVYDRAGEQLTKTVQDIDPSFRMGYLWSAPFKKLGFEFPLKIEGEPLQIVPNNQVSPMQPKPLSELVPAPDKCEKQSVVEYPQYKISAPIQYISFDDMFLKTGENTYDYSKPPVYKDDPKYGDINSPVQKKLEKGVIHMTAVSPMPGEVGNAYIAGHSNNWGFIKSDYNYVFGPINQKNKVGEEFFVWDMDCRKLKFKVFEVKAIEETDVKEAYRNFGDRRVVTLQTSIVLTRNGVTAPFQRWLTRGELVVE
jgi:Sortase domain